MAVAMTDALMMTQADGFTGRNNARDMRTQLLASLFLPDSGGYNLRPGVLPRQYIAVNGFEYVDLKVIQLDTPGQGVKLYPGRCVVARTGQGPYLLSSESTITNYALDTADPSNPRIDVVYARLYDQTIGDTVLHGPYIEHVNGTPGGSPAVPSVPVGALPLAQILRPANTNTVVAANITDVRKGTQLHNTARPLLPGDSTSDPGITPGERRLRIATPAQIAAGSESFIEEIWTGESRWEPLVNKIVGRNQRTTSIGTVATTASTALRIFTAQAQVLAGRTYRITVRGEMLNTAAATEAEVDVRYTTNGIEPTVADTQLFREIVKIDGISIPESLTGTKLYPATTDHQLRVTAMMFSALGGGTLSFGASATNPGEIAIEDCGHTVATAGTVY
jgi:hypothetical protein